MTEQRIPLDDLTSDQLDALYDDVTEMRSNYEGACKTIAAMHAAAVGEVRGPTRGVVEDVEDVRKRAEQAEAERDRVQERACLLAERLRKAEAGRERLRAELDSANRQIDARRIELLRVNEQHVGAALDELRCTHCGGDGVDPEDPGDYDTTVHMYNPYTRGPCPECNGTKQQPTA